MIELFLVRPDEMIEIPTESIVWTGRRYNAARKIDARILYRSLGSRKAVRIYEGDTILFKWRGKELFRGTVFSRSFNKSGVSSFTAYDNLQYLLTNSNTYVFANARADQIIKRVLSDFSIPHDNSTIAMTKHKIKSLIFANETKLYDIILKALIETEKHTKQRHIIRSQFGKVRVEAYKREENVWVLESGVNIEDFTFSTTLDDVATRVKFVAGEDKKQISVTLNDDAGRKKYGVLQHYEKISEKVNKAQLNNLAKQTLARKKELNQSFTINALGIPDLTSGSMVRVIEKETKVDRYYFVDSDSHHFEGNKHLMTVGLDRYNHLPN